MAINSKEFADQLVDYAEDVKENPEKYRGWSSGIPEFDRLVGGILKRKFYVYGGPQKGGKSASMTSLAVALNKQKVTTLVVSLEMDNLEMAMRVFANVTSVDMTKFRDVKITDRDIVELKHSAENISLWPGFWDYGTSDLKDIEKLAQETKCEVLIIDYFQLLESKGSDRRQGLEEISRRLKRMTNPKDKPGITVIVPSQVNRESIRSNRMDANAFLGTGALERDCDVAIMISSVFDDEGEEVSNKKKLRVVASRVSGVGEVEVYFNGARSLIAGAIPEEEANNNIAWWQK
jgi:replicative DNA helicase